MRRTLISGAVIGLVAALGLAGPAQAVPATHYPPSAKVTVLHAVPDTPVDVYLGHTRILDDFQPGTFSPTLKVKPGSYTVRITAASATSWKHPVIGPLRLHFVRDGNYTIAAHLTAGGKPTATKYRNDLAPTGSGTGRLTVRHDAAAPAVDVLANGARAVAKLRNPNQAILTVPVGTISASVALAGTTAPVIGPAHVSVEHGVNTIVYAWGSAKAGDLQLAVQTVRTRRG